MNIFKTQHSKTETGFSLIEMLVVIAIFVVITTIVIARNAQFNNSIILGTLAYDVALSIREAQAYGLGVREVGIGSPEDFDTPHGIEIYSDDHVSEDPSKYYLGADLNDNGWIDESNDERIKTFSLNRGFVISDICGSGVQQSCDSTAPGLSIVFKRPEPDAVMQTAAGAPWEYAEITLESPDGTSQRTVTITNSGQIAVETPGS